MSKEVYVVMHAAQCRQGFRCVYDGLKAPIQMIHLLK